MGSDDAWVSAVVRVMWQGSCGAVISRRQRREELRLGIAVLELERRPVDRRAVEPRRRPGLEPAEREPGAVQALGERDRGRIAEAASGRPLVAEMDHPAQERAGRDHDCAAGDGAAVARDRDRSLAPATDRIRSASPSTTIRSGVSPIERLHGAAVELAVSLGARALDGGSLAAIENPELDAGRIGGARHKSVQRVDLAHEVALAQAADRRIAGHVADRCEAVSDERGRGAEARRRGRGFAAGVPSADDYDVKFSSAFDCFT